ncbi:MAG: zinc ribbon domain-containing protein [Actinobacteria bacterium]|nr:zinc ribbon domain-containing protein [Actinomycetota bacterium]
MIVCPHCRSANEEDARFCAQCGRSLAPGTSLLLSVRRELTPGSELDVEPPRPRSRRGLALMVAAVLLVGGTGWYLAGLRPDPCDGANFASDRFGYCLSVPPSWQAGPASIGTTAVDEISSPTEAATVIIVAVDLADAATLAAYVDAVRDQSSISGLVVGPAMDLTLDGREAVFWDVSAVSELGQRFVMRQVVTVGDRDGRRLGWVISLTDAVPAPRAHVVAFDSILRSWRFR